MTLDISQISEDQMPKHIAVIMDGNGRWATQKKFPRVHGHKNAITAVRDTVEGCAELKVQALTLYAFSTENWGRPKEEVSFLMKMLKDFLIKERKMMMDNNIRLHLVGRRIKLPDEVLKELDKSIEMTSENTGMVLSLALDYGGQQEILDAVKKIASQVQSGEMTTDEVDFQTMEKALYTRNLPELDLVIRTSGEIRLSNFLLWQAAYAELYFTEILWPDFRRKHLHEAIVEFSRRQRRMGKV